MTKKSKKLLNPITDMSSSRDCKGCSASHRQNH